MLFDFLIIWTDGWLINPSYQGFYLNSILRVFSKGFYFQVQFYQFEKGSNNATSNIIKIYKLATIWLNQLFFFKKMYFGRI